MQRALQPCDRLHHPRELAGRDEARHPLRRARVVATVEQRAAGHALPAHRRGFAEEHRQRRGPRPARDRRQRLARARVGVARHGSEVAERVVAGDLGEAGDARLGPREPVKEIAQAEAEMVDGDRAGGRLPHSQPAVHDRLHLWPRWGPDRVGRHVLARPALRLAAVVEHEAELVQVRDPALARRHAVARGRAVELGDVGPLAKGADRRKQLVHVLGPELGGVAHARVQGDAPQRPLCGEPGRDGVETQPAALLGNQVGLLSGSGVVIRVVSLAGI